MRFVFTMNMPNGTGSHPVHQVIGDYPADSCEELTEALNDFNFICVRQYYYEDGKRTGERLWIDKGDLVLNTAQIGKVFLMAAQPQMTITPKNA